MSSRKYHVRAHRSPRSSSSFGETWEVLCATPCAINTADFGAFACLPETAQCVRCRKQVEVGRHSLGTVKLCAHENTQNVNDIGKWFWSAGGFDGYEDTGADAAAQVAMHAPQAIEVGDEVGVVSKTAWWQFVRKRTIVRETKTLWVDSEGDRWKKAVVGGQMSLWGPKHEGILLRNEWHDLVFALSEFRTLSRDLSNETLRRLRDGLKDVVGILGERT